MSCCFFWRNKKRKTEVYRTSVRFPPPRDDDPSSSSLQTQEEIVRCGKCNASLTMPLNAVVFVCNCGIGSSITIPNIPPLFQLGDHPVTSQTLIQQKTTVPICSVCLEGVGDMVIEDCGHGGICEDCALHIAANRSVGGSHCPRCRQPIVAILRIGELHDDTVKCRSIILPDAAGANQPPKVPPPVGYRKSKDTAD